MNLEELEAVGDRKDAHIIIAARGFSSHPLAKFAKCHRCGATVAIFPVSAEKVKQGWYLLCKECYRELVKHMNAKGKPILFGGRIKDNKIPGEEP
jgi:DNA-directed RNA polymerase subunit RPC12/RpoP